MHVTNGYGEKQGRLHFLDNFKIINLVPTSIVYCCYNLLTLFFSPYFSNIFPSFSYIVTITINITWEEIVYFLPLSIFRSFIDFLFPKQASKYGLYLLLWQISSKLLKFIFHPDKKNLSIKATVGRLHCATAIFQENLVFCFHRARYQNKNHYFKVVMLKSRAFCLE